MEFFTAWTPEVTFLRDTVDSQTVYNWYRQQLTSQKKSRRLMCCREIIISKILAQSTGYSDCFQQLGF